MSGAGHRWIDHTADLLLEVWAADEPALLQHAATAVVEALTEGAAITGASVTRVIAIDALDPEDRLVRWINEVLYLASVDGIFVRRATIALHPPGAMTATIEGTHAGPEAIVSEIKSATYHALTLRHDPGRVTATIVLDV